MIWTPNSTDGPIAVAEPTKRRDTFPSLISGVNPKTNSTRDYQILLAPINKINETNNNNMLVIHSNNNNNSSCSSSNRDNVIIIITFEEMDQMDQIIMVLCPMHRISQILDNMVPMDRYTMCNMYNRYTVSREGLVNRTRITMVKRR